MTQQNRTAFSLRDQEVEAALATGEFPGLLEDYFGEEQYRELRQLARDASKRSTRGGPRVLILPGIMGSKIGRRTKFPIFDDVFWIDPIRIAAGKLVDMSLPRGSKLQPLGVVLLAYLKLKLQLQAAGFDADFWPFDWRRSLKELGAELKAKLESADRDIRLVGHSMGGLVARSAIAQGAPYERLIMLGTPNFGSFAPVLALRGVYPVVQKIGWLDTKHDTEQLCRDVFATFPGLVQMLPFRDHFSAIDLYDVASWPGDRGLAPRKDVLSGANGVQDSLSAGRKNFFLIAGVEQKTVVDAHVDGADFVYRFSNEGDGTVPLQFCRLPDIGGTYYVNESHGSLPNNGLVGRAVIDLLEKGSTSLLPDSWSPQRAIATNVPESALRTDPYGGRRSGALGAAELRHLLDEVAAPDSSRGVTGAKKTGAGGGAIEPGYLHDFEQVVVSRRRQHRIDVRFAKGSVTETSARAIAIGVFSDVTPSGAASAIDVRLGGAITEMFRRRMFGARIGEVFILPKGRHALAAEFIAFVGLGAFDRFSEEVLQTAAENLIRTVISARIEEFATVLFGGGSGENPAGALQNLLTGFFRGLRDADRDHQFRRIIVCEMNPERYTALKGETFRLSSTALCHDVEITFDEQTLPEAPRMAALPARRIAQDDPVYLIVREEQNENKVLTVRSSLLTAGSKAAIITGSRPVDAAELETLRHRIAEGRTPDFPADGTRLGELLLADQVQAVLPRYSKHHLVVVHDAAMSKVPWEVLALPRPDKPAASYFPSVEGGLSHRYAAENLAVAKWLEDRIEDDVLSILLVVNPTGDLDGAEKEGRRVREMFAGKPGIRLRELAGAEATRTELLAAFSSGEYDVIHYAGHAFFDPRNPERSGILCHREIPLSGAQLAGLGKLPSLVFFNACEAARVRGRSTAAKRGAARAKIAEKAVGFAEAFMRGGVANFLGTYWPVGDDAAMSFASTFYDRITSGATLGNALLDARRDVQKVDARDWADYVFYGSADFVLKGASV